MSVSSASDYLQIGIIFTLAFAAGLASCFTLWIIPLLQLPNIPDKVKAKQFIAMVDKGEQYLQPSSRLLGLTLVASIAWSYALGSETWKYNAASLAVMVPVAPYEIWFIFPTNDEIKALDRTMEKRGLSDGERRRLDELLTGWQWAHVGRFALPMVAAIVCVFGLLA